jgi:hypothetical protein
LVDVLIEGKKFNRKGVELSVSEVPIVILPLTGSSGGFMSYP